MMSLPRLAGAILVLSAVVLTSGCRSSRQTPQQRYDAAKAHFDFTTKHFHDPAAAAPGAEKARLEAEAASRYQELVKTYPDQKTWAAQATRHLGNLSATQTNLNAALKYYDRVARKYPDQEWEILMAWKSAADLLWEADRKEEARLYYARIIQRFDRPDQSQVVTTVVCASKRRVPESQ